MALGPIPFLSIDAYARRFGPHGPDAFGRFARLIRALDAEHRKLLAPKGKGEPETLVSVNDIDGVKALLKGLSR